MSSTLSFLVSSQIDVSENLLTSLIGRDELTITESPNDEDVIGSFTLDIQKSRIRDQVCFYVHQVNLLLKYLRFLPLTYLLVTTYVI